MGILSLLYTYKPLSPLSTKSATTICTNFFLFLTEGICPSSSSARMLAPSAWSSRSFLMLKSCKGVQYKLLKKSLEYFFNHNLFKYLGICSFSVIYHLKADMFIFTMISNLKQSLVPVLSHMLENMGRSQSESAKINTILCLKINRSSHYTVVVNVTLH